MVKKILPIVLGLIVAGGGYFAYTKFLAGGGPTETPVQAQARTVKKDAAAKKKRLKDKVHGHIYSLGDTFVITLADPGVKAFAKLDVSLMVDADTPVAAAGAHGPTGPPALEEQIELRDLLIDVVSSHSADEMTSAEGRHAVKEAIIEAANEKLPKTVVLEVFFSNVAVQLVT